MNPTILFLAMDKVVGQTGIFNVDIATSLGEENEMKPAIVGLKTDLV